MSSSLGAELPAQIVAGLAGVSASTDQATLLVTVDSGGFPRLSLLSRSELELVHPGRLLIALWAGSQTTANIRRSHTATLFRVDAGVPYSIRVSCDGVDPLPVSSGTPLVVVDAAVVDVRADAVAYASVTSTLTFQVHDPDAVLVRWREVHGRLVELARLAGRLG